MTLEATPQGVSEAQEDDINEEAQKNPRDELLNKLYKKSDAENMDPVEGEAEDATEEGIETEPSVDTTEDVSEELNPDVDMITIKVDGEEREVPREDIYEAGVRTLQKESAADKRLAEASEILKLAKEKAHDEPEDEEHNPSEDQGGDDDFGTRFVKSFYDGDEEEAAEIVNELASKINQRGEIATEDELVEKAVFEMERRSAMNEFQRDDRYSKINDDEESNGPLWTRWDNETGMLRQEHPEWPLLRIAQEAGDRINNMNNVQHTSLDAKRSAVRKTVNSTAAARSQGEPEYKPKTASEIVEEMRKNRGQE